MVRLRLTVQSFSRKVKNVTEMFNVISKSWGQSDQNIHRHFGFKATF